VEYVWDVYLPGEDLPRRITTDYLLAEGDEVSAGGSWIVEAVEHPLEDEAPGQVTVVAPHEPSM
jgi:hypothetical protein